MPHDIDLILTVVGGLTAALVFGFATQRLGLSPLVGYLIAGVAVGPYTPGYVANRKLADQLAEIGVMLLMFGVGLHFHLKELLAVRKVAVPGAIVQIAAATALGVLVAHSAGWSSSAGLVFGLAISVASTVVLTRVLTDARMLHTRTGHIAIGWLVVEDIFTVLVLVLLPVLVGPDAGGSAPSVALALGIAALKLVCLVAFTLIVGQRVIPRLLGYVAKLRSRELFTLTVLVVALGIAVGAAKLFGASMALGAFLAGMVVGQSHYSARAASEALPMRDAFAVLFFVSVGMLLNPHDLLANWKITAATLAVVVIAKPLVAVLVTLLLRHPLKTALAVGVALAQIGEFSFILAALGQKLGVLPERAAQVLVATSILSITVNPMLFRSVEGMARWLSKRPQAADVPPEVGAAPDAIDAEPLDAEHRTIVVGYGPVGRTLTRLLRENGLEPTIVELNDETVKRLRKEGVPVVYGDATQPQILEHAGVGRAGSLMFTAGGAPSEAVIREAKHLNPRLFVLVRASYLREADGLRKAGADVVVTDEAEVALAMVERVLTRLGATDEQLDRERDRAHTELLG